MSKRYDSTKHWYAIHTYSGYEEKVAESIRQRAESLDMADKIFNIVVPKEKMIEIKNGKRKVVEKKIFQGYVLVQMKLPSTNSRPRSPKPWTCSLSAAPRVGSLSSFSNAPAITNCAGTMTR